MRAARGLRCARRAAAMRATCDARGARPAMRAGRPAIAIAPAR
jgi:hypothetical protein